MKRLITFFFMASTLISLTSCKKKEVPETQQPEGYVKLYLNNQEVFNEIWDDINFISARNFVGFNFAGSNGVTRLGGGISNVPDVGGQNGIEPEPQNAATSTLSYVQIDSDTQEYIAPDGNPIQTIIAKTGQVTRPQKDKVIVEGTCIETKDLIHETPYDFRMEVKIANFN